MFATVIVFNWIEDFVMTQRTKIFSGENQTWRSACWELGRRLRGVYFTYLANFSSKDNDLTLIFLLESIPSPEGIHCLNSRSFTRDTHKIPSGISDIVLRRSECCDHITDGYADKLVVATTRSTPAICSDTGHQMGYIRVGSGLLLLDVEKRGEIRFSPSRRNTALGHTKQLCSIHARKSWRGQHYTTCEAKWSTLSIYFFKEMVQKIEKRKGRDKADEENRPRIRENQGGKSRGSNRLTRELRALTDLRHFESKEEPVSRTRRTRPGNSANESTKLSIASNPSDPINYPSGRPNSLSASCISLRNSNTINHLSPTVPPITRDEPPLPKRQINYSPDNDPDVPR
ncbi:14199_t:CDS:2, partial [Acaulospora colombiana]